MAAWSSLAQAASAAHLPGAAEALRLVAMVVQAAQTVSRNRRTCRRLGERAAMVGELLQQLQGSEVMRRRETLRPLVALEETLRRAHRLIVACQGSAAAYRFLMGRKHADQLREVEKDMDSFLLLIPLVKHVHDTRPSNLVESVAAYPLCSQCYLSNLTNAMTFMDKHGSLKPFSNEMADTFISAINDSPVRPFHGCHKQHKAIPGREDGLCSCKDRDDAMDGVRDDGNGSRVERASTTGLGPRYGSTREITEILNAFCARVSQMEETLLQMKSWARAYVLLVMSCILCFVLLFSHIKL